MLCHLLLSDILESAFSAKGHFPFRSVVQLSPARVEASYTRTTVLYRRWLLFFSRRKLLVISIVAQNCVEVACGSSKPPNPSQCTRDMTVWTTGLNQMSQSYMPGFMHFCFPRCTEYYRLSFSPSIEWGRRVEGKAESVEEPQLYRIILQRDGRRWEYWLRL